MPVQCPSCNLSIDKTAHFCPACGSEVGSPEVTAVAPSPESDFSRPPSSTEWRFSAGQRLGERYRIVQRLGRGGMGEVYRADHDRLRREVAIKVLPEHLAADPEYLGRFEREAQAVAQLSHPNIL